MFGFDIWSLFSFFFSRTFFLCLLSSCFKSLLKKKKCLQHSCLYNSMPCSVSTYLVAHLVKSHMKWGRPGFDPRVGKIPWRRERWPALVLWPGEFHWFTGVPKSQTPGRAFHFLFQLKQLKRSNLVSVSSR